MREDKAMTTKERPRILYLEDDPQWVARVEGYLKDRYDIHSTVSVKEARAWLDEKTFDLALVDISLIPGVSGDTQGLQFIEALKQSGILRDINIIIVTAYPWRTRIRKAFRDYGVFDFFDKAKLNPKELKATVMEAIEAGRGKAQE